MNKLLNRLEKEGFRMCVIQLVDSHYCNNPGKQHTQTYLRSDCLAVLRMNVRKYLTSLFSLSYVEVGKIFDFRTPQGVFDTLLPQIPCLERVKEREDSQISPYGCSCNSRI